MSSWQAAEGVLEPAAAMASSSGAADRYQLFRFRNNWYLHAAPELMAEAARRLGDNKPGDPR